MLHTGPLKFKLHYREMQGNVRLCTLQTRGGISLPYMRMNKLDAVTLNPGCCPGPPLTCVFPEGGHGLITEPPNVVWLEQFEYSNVWAAAGKSRDKHDMRLHDQLMKRTSVALSSWTAVLSERPQRCIAQNFIIKAFFFPLRNLREWVPSERGHSLLDTSYHQQSGWISQAVRTDWI